MLMDKLEKAGRLLLWVTLSAAVILGIVGLAAWSTEAKALQLELADAKEGLRKALEPKGPARFPLNGIGPAHTLLRVDDAKGALIFTNVSSIGGSLCVVGVAKHPNEQTVYSLPGCVSVTAYSSARVEVMFLYRDLTALCGKSNEGNCHLSFVEATEPPAVAAPAP
jgi:hypothetical protein